jgi:HEAT repeat protein
VRRPTTPQLDPAERLRAVRRVALGPDGARGLLVAVEDPSPEVCVAALRRLALCGGPAEGRSVYARLWACDLALVGEHARTLHAIGGADIGGLAAALAADRYEVRLRAAIALEVLRVPAAAPALRAAAGDHIGGVRRAALDALRALGPDPGNAYVAAERLADEDPYLRAAAVRAYASAASGPLDGELARCARDPAGVVRVEVARRVGRMAPVAGSALLGDADPEVRIAALGAAGADHVGPIARLVLSDRMPRVRQLAARSLARAGVQAAAPALVEALSDVDAFVRHAARHALVDLVDSARAQELLVDELRADAPERRRAALDSLAALGLAAPYDALARLVEDPSVDVRLALVRLAPTPVLARLRGDADPSVQAAAERRVPSATER